MTAIYERELKSCFVSFVGFLFVAVVLFFVGLYFTGYNMISGFPYFSDTVSSVLFMLLICCPVLTMRVLAEEKRQKTDQMLLTAPVRVGAVVLGKFLALETVLVIPTVIISFYPLILMRYGTIPVADTYIAIIAFFLFGTVCIAIGMFVSSLTENQVISAVLGFGILFICYMMPGICGIISDKSNAVTKILGYLDIYTPFMELASGILSLGAVAYYLSLTAFVLFLTVQSIQKRRYTNSVKNLSMGAYSGGMIVVMLTVVLLLNAAMEMLPKSVTIVDVTDNKLYSLTDTTKEYLDEIREEIQIYVLANEESGDMMVKHTLQQYEEYSDYITVEYVDPAVNPIFYTKYTDERTSLGSIIVECGEHSKMIQAGKLYQQERFVTEDGYEYERIIGYDGEGQITSAIDFVVNQEHVKMYLVTGHDEADLGKRFEDRLEKANVEVARLMLIDTDQIPEDADLLMIYAPETDFSFEDAEKVIRYLERGGKVIAVIGHQYSNANMPGYKTILDYMGISVTNGMVVETKSDYHNYNSQYLLYPEMTNNSYTEELFDTQNRVLAPYALGIKSDSYNAECTYKTILSTSSTSFVSMDTRTDAETDLTAGSNDQMGPFKLGVEAVKRQETVDSVMVIYTGRWIFSDNVDQQISGGNSQLFINTVGSLTDTYASNISIPVKAYELSLIAMPGGSIVLGALGTIILIPAMFLMAGIVIWYKRKRL